MKVEVDDLVDITEIVARLGLKRNQVVHLWIRREVGFPEPVKFFWSGAKRLQIWNWIDVKQWHEMWIAAHEGDRRVR